LSTQGIPAKLRRVFGVAHRLRQEQGQSLVEMAVVLPVAFLMIFGFVDFCLVLFGMANANFASRAALRYATMHSATSYSATTQAQLNGIVGGYMLSYPANTWSVTPTYTGSNAVNSKVSINVTITYHFKVMGRSYNGISYSTTGVGEIQQ
jgi:Flp pilus assembly protein TadG